MKNKIDLTKQKCPKCKIIMRDVRGSMFYPAGVHYICPKCKGLWHIK